MSKKKYIFLNELIDLAQSRLGSKIVYKTDEFFAPAKRIINPWFVANLISLLSKV